MAAARIARPEPCTHENCGSRRFHTREDGYTYCDRGHQQSERGAVIAEDTGELVTLGRKFKRKDSDVESATSRTSMLSGSRAFQHYLLCVQIVLRKQLRWLIDEQKLPEELETLVRDLWALRLQKLQRNVSYESETDTEAESSQKFSSQSESESNPASQSSRRSRYRNATKPKEGPPGLLEILSLCYIGILLLRIPITVADIHGWVNDGALLYYAAYREVRLSMRERLPARYQELLEPQDMLQPQSLHRSILEMLSIFSNDFGMSVPSINSSLVLYRWAKALALPIEVYAATRRLARILDFEFVFDLTANIGSSIALRHPEPRLMSILVVAATLLFPFDGTVRYTQAETDLSAMSLDWKVWADLQTAEEAAASKSISLDFEEAFSFNETDCLEASDEKLDEYLEWYERNVASEEVRELGRAGKEADFRKTLFGMFPSRSEMAAPVANKARSSFDEINGRLQSVQASLKAKTAVDTPATARRLRRAGSSHQRFKTVEDLTGPAKLFFERAAKLAGLSIGGMVKGVYVTETTLQKHEEQLRNERG